MRILFYILLFFALPILADDNPALKNFKGTRGNGLTFIENKGQVIDADKNLRPDILFVGDGGGAKVYLRKTGISYVISNAGSVLGAFKKQHKREIKLKRFDKDLQKLQETYLKEHPITTQRIDMDFEGANENFIV